ncbi:endolytic transglycosylase MltG [Urechidicola vernalis]|uniref:Endolytic murein transglycosylase n=1 Tax=Urechidicola vernalis TaxID=3075600 RepID=A0ABU2Y7X0_9FLAO|nr:endolytic transglycosylase MltG [Urechidicola sp. P050]MDT0554286.1 endolytic transglycosylase MltG [Urechidicola sp. P050]
MNKKKLILIVLSGLLLIGGGIIYNFYSKIYGGNTKIDGVVYIETNASFESVLKDLSPIIRNENSFKWVAIKKNYPNVIKAGRYEIKKGLSNNDLVNLLRSGNQSPIKISFNNQDSLEKLAGRIAEQIEPDSLTLLNSFLNKEFLSVNNFTASTALGMYIPNSYEVYWNISSDKFRDKMLKEYDRFWNSERKILAKKQKLSIKEVTTLASIVQKETQTKFERPDVAKLYLNRLNNKWPLQADPTIIFAVKKLKGQDFEIKRVLLKDLEINSKYNTYKYRGLPPGPISMPDISAIDAVLKPANHDYYYMCADPDNFGRHQFAKTLAQHNINAAKYQQWLNKQGVRR